MTREMFNVLTEAVMEPARRIENNNLTITEIENILTGGAGSYQHPVTRGTGIDLKVHTLSWEDVNYITFNEVKEDGTMDATSIYASDTTAEQAIALIKSHTEKLTEIVNTRKPQVMNSIQKAYNQFVKTNLKKGLNAKRINERFTEKLGWNALSFVTDKISEGETND